MTTKHYLVTGGTGFIGAALVRRLVERGDRVRVLDDNSRGALRRLGSLVDDIEMIEADVRDSHAVRRAAEGVDSILHLAFINGTEFFYSRPELVLDVGVRGMLNVLDAAREMNVPELVLASSSEVYQTPPQVPTDESAPLSVPDVLNPRYSYGGGKIISELMAINYGRTGFERVMIFRPHNVYGPDMGWEHVVPQFAIRAARLAREQPAGRLAFPIQGDGSETRSFIYIDDFADGVVKILDHGDHLSIYHVGTRDERSIAEVARAVVEKVGREAELIPGDLLPGGTRRRCPDISKLEGLGFEPRTSFSEGLGRTVEWYVDNESSAPGRE